MQLYRLSFGRYLMFVLLCSLNTRTMENHIKSIDHLHLLTIHVGFASHNADWNWKEVSSPFTRLYYVTRGSARVILPDGVRQLSPHHLYLIPAFTVHSYECEGEFDHYYIHIYEDAQSSSGFLEDFVFPFEVPADALDLSLCKRLCEINPTMKLTQSNPTSYDNNSMLIQNIMRNKQRVLCDRVESRGILYQLMARFLKDARPKSDAGDNRIQKSITYIRKHINENIKIETLADIVCISKDHFIRLFKKETGMTPVQYISQKKIEKAQLLLVTEEMPIKEIAFLLSYEDHSYFNRLFKKITGGSPQEYRRNHLKK